MCATRADVRFFHTRSLSLDLLSDPVGRALLGTIVWSLASCVLITMVWTKWFRAKTDPRFDPGFIVGNLLCSLSCFSFALSYVILLLPHSSWEEGGLYKDLTEFAWVCLMGILVVPFGYTRLKWRSLLICIGNPILVFAFFFLYGE